VPAEDQNREEANLQSTNENHSFDELAKGLANGSATRRQALRWMGAALLGGGLASIPGEALAHHKPEHTGGGGGGGGTPSTGSQGCPAPKIRQQGQCVCPDVPCQGGTVNANCQCECPTGTTLCGGSCAPSNCPEGQTFNPNYCTCIAPITCASEGVAAYCESFGYTCCPAGLDVFCCWPDCGAPQDCLNPFAGGA